MALLCSGWGLGRGLLSLAAVGFAFHLQQKVLHLEKCVRKLEDEEKLRDVHAEARGFEMQTFEYAVLHPEFSKDLLHKQVQNFQLESRDQEPSRDVEGLERRVQELEYDNKNLIELYSEASQRGDCMKGKLAVAEMQIKEHELVKEEVSKNLMQLESQKSELSREVERLQKLVRELEDKQCVFEAYRTEMEISMAAALEKVREKDCECEDLAVQNKRHLREKEELQREIERLCNQEEAISAPSSMEQSSPTSSACSKSIGRDPRSASAYTEWHDNSLYESEATMHTKTDLFGYEEKDSISVSFIKWHDNPLYETKPARFTTTALSGHEEVTNGSKFVDRNPRSASPVIKRHDNPLYETMTTSGSLSDDEELTDGLESKGRDPSSASPFIKWYHNPLYEPMPVRFTTAHKEVINGIEVRQQKS